MFWVLGEREEAGLSHCWAQLFPGEEQKISLSILYVTEKYPQFLLTAAREKSWIHLSNILDGEMTFMIIYTCLRLGYHLQMEPIKPFPLVTF